MERRQERLFQKRTTLHRATEEVSDNADDAGSSGVDAINGIAGALAGAGITAKVAEIAAAVYDLADSFSEAEKTVIAQTGRRAGA